MRVWYELVSNLTQTDKNQQKEMYLFFLFVSLFDIECCYVTLTMLELTV